MTRGILPATLALVLAVSAAQGDGLLFSFEGDILPGDPGTDIVIANPCEDECSRRLEVGHFLLEWGAHGDIVNYHHFVADVGETPPATLWVEWNFRSNEPLPPQSTSCDGRFKINYLGNDDTANMFQDTVVDFEGGDFVAGLEPGIFHTHRFENIDGVNYTFAVDGVVYNVDMDPPAGISDFFQFGGFGDCSAPPDRPVPVRNEWDFIRYGTIETGETVVSSDPPAGALHFPVDRFRVTFDSPNYAYVDDISVAVTGGVAPNVIATRRPDNGPPETLEVLLDGPLPIGETTTFTFLESQTPSSVTYNVVQGGACCTPGTACFDTTAPDCSAAGGTFVEGEPCTEPQPCCIGSTCSLRDPLCCEASQGSVVQAAACEGDIDADGIDALCGDDCPADPDNDIDGDGLCAGDDDCPLLNPNDANNDGIADCFAIPTVSAWGLVILTLTFVVGGVLMARYGGHPLSKGR